MQNCSACYSIILKQKKRYQQTLTSGNIGFNLYPAVLFFFSFFLSSLAELGRKDGRVVNGPTTGGPVVGDDMWLVGNSGWPAVVTNRQEINEKKIKKAGNWASSLFSAIGQSSMAMVPSWRM